MKLLLHCCCAPCAIKCADFFRSEGIEPLLLWYNPNIHPSAEYALRRDSLTSFAANENLELKMHDEYGLRLFLNETFPYTEGRCKKCYFMRLEKVASVAAEEGFKAFTTSLLISPYQEHEAVRRIGEEAAARHGVEFLYRDFRPLFREGQSAARSMGVYMQKYCGCIFSEEERFSGK